MENMENTNPATPSTPHFFSNQYEHGMSYQRPDGQRLEGVLVHLPGSEPTLHFAIFPLTDNPNLEPSVTFPPMSIEEARWRYEFFAGLKEAGLFDPK